MVPAVPPEPFDIPSRPYLIAGVVMVLGFGIGAIVLLAFGL